MMRARFKIHVATSEGANNEARSPVFLGLFLGTGGFDGIFHSGISHDSEALIDVSRDESINFDQVNFDPQSFISRSVRVRL